MCLFSKMSSDTCRLCLSKKNLGPIFVDMRSSERYITVLSLTTGLNIEPNDGYPQQICKKCTNLVNSAIYLRNISHKTNDRLRNTEKYEKQKHIDVIDNSINKDNFILVDDGLDNDGLGLPNFEVKIQFDRLSDIKNGGNSTVNEQAKKTEEIQLLRIEKSKRISRKEKKAMYMNLVDGVLSPKGPVKCKICKKTVSKWSCFISHAKLHLGFKFMCEYCGKSFISTTQLKRHCRSYHGMQRELACKHCNYLALDNAQLLVHERRVHTGERPFICDICASAYFNRRCLIQHLESHRTVATFQCGECSRVFLSGRHLARHRYASHAGGRRRPCPHCARTYCRKYLPAHITKHHPDTIHDGSTRFTNSS